MPSTDAQAELAEADRRYLLDLARESIRHGLRHGRPLPVDLERLAAPLTVRRACFVTLELQGRLRGCIGSLEAVRPLAQDVAANAYAAAFRDPRFPPLSEAEFAGLDLHLSLLTPPQPFPCASEADLLQRLRPGRDGLILQEGSRRATFLPSVWEQLPDRQSFLLHLKRKGGWPDGYWSEQLQVFRYGTETIP